ncbi:MAG: hypothetical protein AAFX45_10995, partial [Pseudomonadota bacterium]
RTRLQPGPKVVLVLFVPKWRRHHAARGMVAVNDGAVQTQEGHGKFVKRPPAMPVTKALSTWKELTAPRKVERSGIPATGV